MRRHFFFAPLPEVIAMAGGPQPRPDALLTWLAVPPDQKPDREKLKMDRKTLKRAMTSSSLTKQTRDKLDELLDGLQDRAGVPGEMRVRLTDDDAFAGWDAWEIALDGLEKTCPSDWMPETRRLLRLRLAEDAALMQQPCTELSAALTSLQRSAIAVRLAHGFDVEQALAGWTPCNSADESIRALNSHPGFQHWLWHCMVSQLMEILACADLECCTKGLPGNCPARDTSTRVVGPILPALSGTVVTLPVRRLFEHWRAVAKKKSWEALALSGGVELRKMRRWIDDEVIAPVARITAFLEALGCGDWERNVASLRYAIALLLTRLYERAPQHLPAEQRVLAFDTFRYHLAESRSGQETASPARTFR